VYETLSFFIADAVVTGAVASIIIVCDWTASLFPALSVELYLMYDVPAVEIWTGTVYAVVGVQSLVEAVQYFVEAHPLVASVQDRVTVT
jgi:hypothetical protein